MPAPDKNYQVQIVDDLGNADGNADVIALASAARTTTQTINLVNPGARGVIVTFDITAVPTVETVTLACFGIDPASGKAYALGAAGAALATTGTRTYLIYPAVAANGSFTAVIAANIPRTWRITITHSASGSFTYSVGVQYLI
jgi:hypothetical protein